MGSLLQFREIAHKRMHALLYLSMALQWRNAGKKMKTWSLKFHWAEWLIDQNVFFLLMQVYTVKKTSMSVRPTHVTMVVCALTWSMALCAHAHGATMTPSASLTLTSVRPTRVSMAERVEMEWTGLYFCFSPHLVHTVIVLTLILGYLLGVYVNRSRLFSAGMVWRL